VRVIVNSGVGRHFQTGADVVEIATDGLGFERYRKSVLDWDMGSASSDANAAVAARSSNAFHSWAATSDAYARGPSRPPNPAAPTRRSPSKRPSPPGWCSRARCGSTLACRRCDGQAAPAATGRDRRVASAFPKRSRSAPPPSASRPSARPSSPVSKPPARRRRRSRNLRPKRLSANSFHAHRRPARAATRHRRPASPPAWAAGPRPPGRPGRRGSAG
jgi:hypothetical protein